MKGIYKNLGAALVITMLATVSAEARDYAERTHHTYGSYGWSGDREYYTDGMQRPYRHPAHRSKPMRGDHKRSGDTPDRAPGSDAPNQTGPKA